MKREGLRSPEDKKKGRKGGFRHVILYLMSDGYTRVGRDEFSASHVAIRLSFHLRVWRDGWTRQDDLSLFPSISHRGIALTMDIDNSDKVRSHELSLCIMQWKCYTRYTERPFAIQVSISHHDTLPLQSTHVSLAQINHSFPHKLSSSPAP